MTDRPILFSAAMVRALLDGRKTQTRRLAWRAAREGENFRYEGGLNKAGDLVKPTIWQKVRPGDRLWVREAFATTDGGPLRYYATDDVHELRRKRPSIHMPRRASRLTLVVTETKLERLQEIHASDAIAEGMDGSPINCLGPSCPASCNDFGCWGPRDDFGRLWDSLHKPGNRWQDNPEVVALSFTVHKTNIDRTEAA